MVIPWWGLLILFPLACAAIGWITNVIAVKMIFWPLEPIRILGLPFQGVVPKHQEHFAREMGIVITTDFITTEEMVERLDMDRLYKTLKPTIDQAFAEIVEDLRSRLDEPQRALLSDSMIESLGQQVEQQLIAELPAFREQIQKRANTLVDLADVVAEKLIAIGPAKLEELIYRVAHRELKFIEYYGGIFGFLIGLLQFGVINVFPVRYSLPLIGLIVGTVTNYLAIQMLFYPRQARGPWIFKIQGLFPKRQDEIARELALIAAEGFVVVDELFGMLTERALPKQIDRQLLDQYEEIVAKKFPAIKAMLESMLGPEKMDQFRDRLVMHYDKMMPRLRKALVQEAAEQLDLEDILTHRLAGLSKLRFEGLIRGLFKKEELYLVVYGGALGALMGCVQLGLLILSRLTPH
jgi:uncharacterized membrane protein YheB (UPF0754 family)